MLKEVKLFSIVFDFLSNLTDEQLDLLINKDIKLLVSENEIEQIEEEPRSIESEETPQVSESVETPQVSESVEKPQPSVVPKRSKIGGVFDAVDEVVSTISGMKSREEAVYYLLNLNLKKDDLKEICSAKDIKIRTYDNKDVIIDRIVEAIVGAKLKHDALLNTELR